MSKAAELFADHKLAGKQRRAGHRETSPQVLIDSRVAFESKNGGAHLVVTGVELVVDFWPGTGKWIVRNAEKTTGRGVFNLVRLSGVRKIKAKRQESTQ